MKSLIVFLVLLVCPQLSLAAVDAWRMNQFTGKPDYYQTGIDSTTIEAIAVSTTALAAQTSALDISTQALASRATALESSTSTLKTRVDALEVSTATLDSTLSAEIQVRQELATQVAIDTTAIGGVSLSAYNEFTSSNSFASILVASGTHGAGDTLTASGVGSRFFYYPKKSAFRAGRVIDDKWDDANIGNYSAAMGYQSFSSGEGSFNFGYWNAVYSQYGGSFAGSGNVVGSAGTGSNSVALGGNGNHVNDTAGTSGATIAGNELSVETDFSVCVGGQTNAVNGAGTHSVTLGGSNVTVSGTKSAAGGQWVQNAADYSFAFGNYVGLGSAADGSTLFGYDTSSVKTYNTPNKFIIHGQDLWVSSATDASRQFGISKTGTITAETPDITGISRKT
jgi:hypothetical protein